MITTVLIDDQQKSIDDLSYLFEKLKMPVSVVATANSGKDGLVAILKHKPKMVFLDIVMPGMSGFEMLELIPKIDFSLIIIQGITYDEYDKMIENCFLRTVDQDVNKKWYSGNYDSTHIESSSGLFYSADNKILLFGSRSADHILDGFGEAFGRIYSTSGELEEEKVYPHVGGSLNVFKRTIQSPDGGYLMIGSNNQLPSDIIVSPNQLVLMKLNADLSVSRTNIINTGLPCRGFEAAYLSDGSIGVVGLMKDINSTNKLIYFHLDSNYNLVNN